MIGNLIDSNGNGKKDIVFIEMVGANCNSDTSTCNINPGGFGSPITLDLVVIENNATFINPVIKKYNLPNTFLPGQDTSINLLNKSLEMHSLNFKGKEYLFVKNDRLEDHYIINLSGTGIEVQTIPKHNYLGNYFKSLVVDLDGDGYEDIIDICLTGSGTIIYYSDKNNYFTSSVLQDSCNIKGLIAVDVNNNGKKDIVALKSKTSSSALSQLVVYYALGNREFSDPEVLLDHEISTAPLGHPILSLDLDGNSWPDYIVGSSAEDLSLKVDGYTYRVEQKSISP